MVQGLARRAVLATCSITWICAEHARFGPPSADETADLVVVSNGGKGAGSTGRRIKPQNEYRVSGPGGRWRSPPKTAFARRNTFSRQCVQVPLESIRMLTLEPFGAPALLWRRRALCLKQTIEGEEFRVCLFPPQIHFEGSAFGPDIAWQIRRSNTDAGFVGLWDSSSSILDAASQVGIFSLVRLTSEVFGDRVEAWKVRPGRT